MLFVVQDRAEALVRDNHDVHVITTGIAGKAAAVLNGVKIHYLDCEPLVYTDRFAEACIKKTTELAPDLLHLDSFDPERVWWKRMSVQPYTAVTMHGLRIGERLTSYNRWLLRQETTPGVPAMTLEQEARTLRECFDRVLAISEWEYLQLVTMYNVPERIVRKVYNPIASYFYDTPAVLPDTASPTFLCVAVSGHDQRNFFLAEEAAKAVGFKLQVVKNKARIEMPTVYDKAYGLVIPTTYAKGFDLTFAEALSRQRPVICSTSSPYFLESQRYDHCEHKHVYRVNMGDSKGLGMVMQQVVNDFQPQEMVRPQKHRPEVHVEAWLQAME